MKKLQHGRKKNWIANLALHVLRSYLFVITYTRDGYDCSTIFYFHIIIIYNLITFLVSNLFN
jgi:hypothetical protein